VLGHRSQVFKIYLRAVKAGKILETVNFKIFEGLNVEVKVFANARSSSIRAKKIGNLNSSRDLRSEFRPYETLLSCGSDMNLTSRFNKTDVLGDIRSARMKKLHKQHVETDASPKMVEPQLDLVHDYSASKLFFPKKETITKHRPEKSTAKLGLKELTKYTRSLNIT
jgi:hypothetical protein